MAGPFQATSEVNQPDNSVTSARERQAPPDADTRHTFIGGSEAFELLYELQYGRGCARALANRKLGIPEDVRPDHTSETALQRRAILQRGHWLEDLVARMYMDATGRSLIRRNRLVRHPDHPGAGVHTDRLILAFDERGTGDAEIKTHSEGVFLHICRDGLPPAHNLQIQWSLFCTGHRWGAFVILGVFGAMPLKHFDVERNAPLMDIFGRATDNFWNGLAHNELPPRLPDPNDIRCRICPYRLSCRGELLDAGDYERLMNEREGKRTLTQIHNDELDELLTDHALVKGEIAELSSENKNEPGALQLITRRIKEILGDQDAVVVNQRWVVYCYDHKWSGIDVQRLKEDEPEIYKKYYVNRKPTGTKVLRVYTTGEKHDSHDAKDR